MDLKYINNMDRDYKYEFLLDSEIDEGIRPITDAINNNSDFVTINSCQGEMDLDTASNHCPLTYVDFYVFDHKYDIANNLFSELMHKFGQMLECKVYFEADLDYYDNGDYVETNGFVNLRFRIEIMSINNWYKEPEVIIQEVSEEINKYNEMQE